MSLAVFIKFKLKFKFKLKLRNGFSYETIIKAEIWERWI